jgi:hypothetical protein
MTQPLWHKPGTAPRPSTDDLTAQATTTVWRLLVPAALWLSGSRARKGAGGKRFLASTPDVPPGHDHHARVAGSRWQPALRRTGCARQLTALVAA